MVHAAVEISPTSVRYSVASFGARNAGTVTAGFTPVQPGEKGLLSVPEAVADGVREIRSTGIRTVPVLIAPELRGTPLARAITRRVREMDLPAPIVGGTGAGIAAACLRLGVGPPDEVANGARTAVLGLGHDSLGLAVGPPGFDPEWIGSRPAGPGRLRQRARVEDPPEPAQLAAVTGSVERALGSFASPEFDRLVAVSEFASPIEALAGPSADESSLSDALGSIIGMTSEELDLRTGIGRGLARLLPVALSIHLAATRVFGLPLVTAGSDPARMAAVPQAAGPAGS